MVEFAQMKKKTIVKILYRVYGHQRMEFAPIASMNGVHVVEVHLIQIVKKV